MSEPQNEIEVYQLAAGDELVLKSIPIPDLLAMAQIRVKDQLTRTQPENPKDPMLEWQSIFNAWPRDEILNFIISDSEKANQLRQSSPLVGCLNIGQRRRLNLAFWRIFKSLSNNRITKKL